MYGSRDAGVGKRPDGIGRTRRSVFGVLVVIKKDSVTFFLPPLGAGKSRCAPLNFTRERERGTPDLDKTRARFDRRVDMNAARAARFGPALKSCLLQKRLHFESNPPNIVPLDARTGIEIDAQFVRMVEIAGSNCVRM